MERNRANDTFGWGVVLSDDALGRMKKNDPVSTDANPQQLCLLGPTSRWSTTAIRTGFRAGTALRALAASGC